jgi:hypothetical protein
VSTRASDDNSNELTQCALPPRKRACSIAVTRASGLTESLPHTCRIMTTSVQPSHCKYASRPNASASENKTARVSGCDWALVTGGGSLRRRPGNREREALGNFAGRLRRRKLRVAGVKLAKRRSARRCKPMRYIPRVDRLPAA